MNLGKGERQARDMNERDMDDNVKTMAMIRGINTGLTKTGWKNTRVL